MKIEVGKYYKTRDGRKVGPAETRRCGEYPFNIPEGKYFHAYTVDGTSCFVGGPSRDYDIVAEWVDGEVGTLKALGVKAGDVVECLDKGTAGVCYTQGMGYTVGMDDNLGLEIEPDEEYSTFRIVYRAPTEDAPKTWGEMTDAEKGALLLAKHEGKTIEVMHPEGMDFGFVYTSWPSWFDTFRYRIKPEPVVETVTLHGRKYVTQVHPTGVWGLDQNDKRPDDTHRITFNTIDGVPDCGSIKMEEV